MALFRQRTRLLDPADAWEGQRVGTLVIVDVRQRREWNSGVVPGAERIPLSELSRRVDELPQDVALAFLCRSGHRSLLAARQARRRGAQVASIRGGMAAWGAADLPVSEPG
jgi:rhodanese-related sulfurtransferase